MFRSHIRRSTGEIRLTVNPPNPVGGAVTVALEQKDGNGVDRVVMSAMAGADGTFAFCPVPAGTYDVVVVGTRNDGAFYAPSIVTGVAVGDTTGTLSLYMPASAATSGAVLNGLVTSQNSSNAGTASDIQVSALETVNSVTYTIPLPPTTTQDSAMLTVTTAPSTTTLTCTSGTDCASYIMQIASAGPYIAAWSSSAPSLAQSAPLATYVVDGIAFVPGGGGTTDCNPSDLQSSPASALTGLGPYTVTVPTLTFTTCQ